jgi:hypothetical protein
MYVYAQVTDKEGKPLESLETARAECNLLSNPLSVEDDMEVIGSTVIEACHRFQETDLDNLAVIVRFTSEEE